LKNPGLGIDVKFHIILSSDGCNQSQYFFYQFFWQVVETLLWIFFFCHSSKWEYKTDFLQFLFTNNEVYPTMMTPALKNLRNVKRVQ